MIVVHELVDCEHGTILWTFGEGKVNLYHSAVFVYVDGANWFILIVCSNMSNGLILNRSEQLD